MDTTSTSPSSEHVENPGGIVYGVVAIGTLIAAEGARRDTHAQVIEASCLAVLLYWLAHGYARYVNARAEDPESAVLRRLGLALAHELTILIGAVVPLAALVVAWVAGTSLAAGVNIAIGVAGAEIVALEVTDAVTRKLKAKDFVVEVGTGVLLGIGILGVRLLLH
jgi:hypothetical protein